ncbi:hypothetical protein CP533_6573 [Ophiocordyceps camponoti-saundersi (nom. inval.)]|nr:hypothetical protein CP533_6573 [Ophiocordyceps camponoti-saundersi (nom. inval.)]
MKRLQVLALVMDFALAVKPFTIQDGANMTNPERLAETLPDSIDEAVQVHITWVQADAPEAFLTKRAKEEEAAAAAAAPGRSPGRTPTDEQAGQIAEPETISATEAAYKIVPDGSQPGILYRGDSRPPKDIFETGFEPQGDDMDLRRHLSFSGNSGYVSVSRSRHAAARYSFDRSGNKKEVGYLYRIAPHNLPDGYWIPGWYRGPEIEGNQEFAIPGKIPMHSIHSARALYLREPSRKGEWIKNPQFQYQSAVCKVLRKRELCLLFPEEEELQLAAKEEGDQKTPLDEPVSYEHEDLVMSANIAANRHFTSLARRLDIGLEYPNQLVEGPDEYSVRFQRYRKVLSVAKGNSILTRMKFSDVLGLISLPFYIKSVRESFTHNAIISRKLATVTAIVPFAGCTMEALNRRAESGASHRSTRLKMTYFIDETLCLVSDVLLFSPRSPMAILAKMISPLVLAYATGDLGHILDRDFVFDFREREWNRILFGIKDALTSTSYEKILARSYREEISASLFVLSQQSVLLYMGRRLALKDDVSQEEALKINVTFGAEFMEVQRRVCQQMNRTNRRFEEEIAIEVGSSIRNLKKEYYRRFAEEYYQKMKLEEEKVLRKASAWVRLFPRLGHRKYWERLHELVHELRSTKEVEFDDSWVVWKVQRTVLTKLDLFQCGACNGVYSSLSEALEAGQFLSLSTSKGSLSGRLRVSE